MYQKIARKPLHEYIFWRFEGFFSSKDDIQRVGRPKRKKTGGIVVGDGQAEQNLLNLNKFKPLVKQNNNNNNGDAAVTAADKSIRGRKQPPLVVKNTSCGMLRQIMSSCAVKPIYKLTAASRRKIRCS